MTVNEPVGIGYVNDISFVHLPEKKAKGNGQHTVPQHLILLYKKSQSILMQGIILLFAAHSMPEKCQCILPSILVENGKYITLQAAIVLIGTFKKIVVLVEQTVSVCFYCFYTAKLILLQEIYLVQSVLGFFTFSLQKAQVKVSRGPGQYFKLQKKKRKLYFCTRLCNPMASSDARLEIYHFTG